MTLELRAVSRRLKNTRKECRAKRKDLMNSFTMNKCSNSLKARPTDARRLSKLLKLRLDGC